MARLFLGATLTLGALVRAFLPLPPHGIRLARPVFARSSLVAWSKTASDAASEVRQSLALGGCCNMILLRPPGSRPPPQLENDIISGR
jgi:hypothetical protein